MTGGSDGFEAPQNLAKSFERGHVFQKSQYIMVMMICHDSKRS